MWSVRCNRLGKSYGRVKALQEVTLEVKEGELFGIIGPDGAGKTTLFRILATLLLPDAGQAEVCGLDVVRDYRKIRQKTGYMPGKFSLYQDLTVEENLKFFATLFGTTVEKNHGLIDGIYRQIEPFKTRRAGKLSGGMKQKLALCCALVHRPEILLLDEPTTGVDAVSRQEFWDMLEQIRKEGITIVVSTPYMDEAARCGRIALMNGGRFLATDTPDAVADDYPHALFGVCTDSMHRLLTDLRGYALTRSAYSFGDTVHATFTATPDLADLRKYLLAAGHGKVEIERIKAGVEDCFILQSEQEGGQ